ncbi:hypothetical protein CBR_g22368 [Chara braunii]|uniref:Uncharacterized protein n=1 Tax=Chara braunii TaxID=69332 RepID=A0A388JUU5_CHABU|nr:hypothetical protein CBR_g22368 [Chara braunii]|eukprot:GBG61571.1 hypothetical protein CBR_g22368 [Chara braunii]
MTQAPATMTTTTTYVQAPQTAAPKEVTIQCHRLCSNLLELERELNESWRKATKTSKFPQHLHELDQATRTMTVEHANNTKLRGQLHVVKRGRGRGRPRKELQLKGQQVMRRSRAWKVAIWQEVHHPHVAQESEDHRRKRPCKRRLQLKGAQVMRRLGMWKAAIWQEVLHLHMSEESGDNCRRTPCKRWRKQREKRQAAKKVVAVVMKMMVAVTKVIEVAIMTGVAAASELMAVARRMKAKVTRKMAVLRRRRETRKQNPSKLRKTSH